MKRPVFRLVLFTLLCVRCVSADSSSGPAAADCSDGKWNGQETDRDCGGPVCGKCGAKKACLVDSDCVSSTCLSIKVCSSAVSEADMATADVARVDIAMDDMTPPPRPGMIKRVVYSDTFTLGGARRDGLYDDNSAGAYRVETSPDGVVWTPASSFSFNSTGSSSNPLLLGTATGNSGASTGLAQTGRGDFNFQYNDPAWNYTVQADAIIPEDRFDISSVPFAGADIYTTGALSIFFRRPGPLPGIGIYTAGTEADTGCTTGISDTNWHNFAVNFDQTTNHVRMFVDRALRCELDLTTFFGGRYRSYSKAAVGMGGNGAGAMATWMDNFQAGPAG